ncbi:unnamed protein product [Paramecium sonneborni]|uniref:Uncharacterized protein n=1 Tax=Paramecium sonneborni TaxID=65129 RepID=A0A8S1K195_9CILI|nr:unnamed protein product [Paramecium sonneborni]
MILDQLSPSNKKLHLQFLLLYMLLILFINTTSSIRGTCAQMILTFSCCSL